jgi:hypothetical protein
VKVYFACPSCDYPGRQDVPGPGDWRCPACDRLVPLPAGPVEPVLPACVICGNTEVYKKKDFPHALGLAILAVACLASTVTYYLYDPWLTWVILIGSAAFDGLLYLWVKDVVVCYRCGAHHRGLPPGSDHEPFELTIHERYRQERLRREQLAAQRAASPPRP